MSPARPVWYRYLLNGTHPALPRSHSLSPFFFSQRAADVPAAVHGHAGTLRPRVHRERRREVQPGGGAAASHLSGAAQLPVRRRDGEHEARWVFTSGGVLCFWFPLILLIPPVENWRTNSLMTNCFNSVQRIWSTCSVRVFWTVLLV